MSDQEKLITLAKLVKQMRAAQKLYFVTHASWDLDTAKALERQIDLALVKILDERPTLFPVDWS